MYRVELKGISLPVLAVLNSTVPNVPCGVERYVLSLEGDDYFVFLMYRVELKERLQH